MELAKYTRGIKSSSGDHFAIILPFSLTLGRAGCIHAECCQGIPLPQHFLLAVRNSAEAPVWPASAVEAGFLLLLLPDAP